MLSFRRASTLALIVAAVLNLILPTVAQAAAVVGPTWATKMLMYNASNADCVVLVVVQGKVTSGNAPPQEGCPSDIRLLRYLDLGATAGPQQLTVFTNTATGWFLLKRGHTVQMYSTSVNPLTGQPTYCLQGFNIGFQGQSAACPLLSMPFPNTTVGPQFNQDVSKYASPPAVTLPKNGVNGFEGSINLTGIESTTHVYTPAPEAVDITCLGGANSKLTAQITPPAGGPFWTFQAGPKAGGNLTYTRTATFQNSWVKIVSGNPAAGCDDNCVDPRTGLARPGIFPYGCSTCNAYPDPAPPCGIKQGKPYASQFCAARNFLPSPPGGEGCQLNRNAPTGTGQKFGGTIKLVYYGPITPPTTCPPTR
jgi:hypothetical protein